MEPRAVAVRCHRRNSETTHRLIVIRVSKDRPTARAKRPELATPKKNGGT
jgi:hypothetical protein